MCFSLFPSQLTATKQQVLIYSRLSSKFFTLLMRAMRCRKAQDPLSVVKLFKVPEEL